MNDTSPLDEKFALMGNLVDLLSIANNPQNVPQEMADKLVFTLLNSPYRGLFDASLIKSAERLVLLDARQKCGARQGVLSNKARAEARRNDVVHLAHYLIGKRFTAYSSISQLAKDIESESGGEYSYEHVRKILAKENLIK